MMSISQGALINKKCKNILFVFLLFLFYFQSVQASNLSWSELAKLIASDGAQGDYFGQSIAINGNTIVVGAHWDDDNGTSSGSAYVFVKPEKGWASVYQTAKLSASDSSADDQFGSSIGISGDTIVVGMPLDDDNGLNSGSVYVFTKPVSGWANMTQTAKFTASDGAVDDWFGNTVAIDGDTIVVGVSGDDDNGTESGSVYVFEKPVGGWVNMTQTAKLTASDGAADDYFGNTVAIDNDMIVVGARFDDDNGLDSGSVYVFTKPIGGWANITQAAKLTASDGATEDWFGNSVAISGETIIAGTPNDDDNGLNSGSVYVFTKPVSGWDNMTQTAKLTASDGAADDYFGLSTTISSETIVVGAPYDDVDSCLNCGSAYVFEKPANGWTNATQTTKLTASDGVGHRYFGFPVSNNSQTIVIGARFDDVNGPVSGSVYLFEKIPQFPWLSLLPALVEGAYDKRNQQ